MQGESVPSCVTAMSLFFFPRRSTAFPTDAQSPSSPSTGRHPVHDPFCAPMLRFNPSTAPRRTSLGRGGLEAMGRGQNLLADDFFPSFPFATQVFRNTLYHSIFQRMLEHGLYARSCSPGRRKVKCMGPPGTSKLTLTCHYLSLYLDRENFSRFRI